MKYFGRFWEIGNFLLGILYLWNFESKCSDINLFYNDVSIRFDNNSCIISIIFIITKNSNKIQE
jgi:hypothetical protein